MSTYVYVPSPTVPDGTSPQGLASAGPGRPQSEVERSRVELPENP